MSNPSEPLPPASDPEALPGEPWNEERIAAILLRLLGVYFLSWAAITGLDEVVRIATVAVKYGLDSALRNHWTYFSYIAAQFLVGAYLLFGGRWIYEKVLTPVVYVDPDDAIPSVASGLPTPADQSPSSETE